MTLKSVSGLVKKLKEAGHNVSFAIVMLDENEASEAKAAPKSSSKTKPAGAKASGKTRSSKSTSAKGGSKTSGKTAGKKTTAKKPTSTSGKRGRTRSEASKKREAFIRQLHKKRGKKLTRVEAAKIVHEQFEDEGTTAAAAKSAVYALDDLEWKATTRGANLKSGSTKSKRKKVEEDFIEDIEDEDDEDDDEDEDEDEDDSDEEDDDDEDEDEDDEEDDEEEDDDEDEDDDEIDLSEYNIE